MGMDVIGRQPKHKKPAADGDDLSVMKTRGRKTLLIAAERTAIVKLLEKGHTIKTVMAARGFSERSFHTWCEEDESFLAATQRARAIGRMRLVDDILAEKDWRAKAWYLERTDPEQFGRVAERQIPTPIAELAGPTVNVTHVHDDQSIEMRRLQDEFSRRLRAERDGQPFSAPDSKTPTPPVVTPVIGTDAGEKLVSDRGAAANLMKRHALSGRASQIPTSDR
jgi:hypothetical protein